MVRIHLTVAVLAVLVTATPLQAQFQFTTDPFFELSDSVDIKDLPNEAATHLARVDALAANSNWDEAVETLRRVAQAHGRRLIELDPRHYINVRDYCQLRLMQLPVEARQLYRDRVDAVAEQWYEEGLQNRDPEPLQRIIDELFCSSRGDDALLVLGELALEKGHYTAARWSWERISPQLRLADGHSTWYAMAGLDLAEDWNLIEAQLNAAENRTPWLAYPDTDLELADIRARLILVSVHEGATDRALYGVRMNVMPAVRRSRGTAPGYVGRLWALSHRPFQL